MIESMACGTPVLAFGHGSVPEIVEDGITGKIVNSEEEAIDVIPALLALDRRGVRRRFEERFSSTRMAKDYLTVYRSILRRPLGTTAEVRRPVPSLSMEESLN
jgi:glycosyltransferase involved in cell wall biosynthesis